MLASDHCLISSSTFENLDRFEQILNEDLVPFVDTLRALANVKKACFGRNPDPNYKEIVSNFESKWFEIYIEFDVAFTNMCHIIIDHVPQVTEQTSSRRLQSEISSVLAKI